jgi:hypothetical protein
MSVPVRVRAPAPFDTISTELRDKRLQMIIRAKVLLPAVLLLAGFLAGCSTPGSGESRMSFMSVPPGRYLNYTCPQLEGRAAGVNARRTQLEQLMAKAGTSLDGRVIGFVAYQAEYSELGGDLIELRRTAAEKKCKPSAALQVPAAR